MTIHKSVAASLILLAGVVPAGVAGCKGDWTASAQSEHEGGGSGAVSIHKMGGEIDVKDAPHGASLSTMGGDIHIRSVGAFATAKTMGGKITIDQANASVDASTMGGTITVKDATGAVSASTMAGDITVRLVGSSAAQRDVHLSSNAGAITLVVPKDFPMDVRIKLAYTKGADRKFEIMDRVGLSQRESADWDASQGSPRKYIYAEGRVGSGQNHVQIDTINGDGVLKQE